MSRSEVVTCLIIPTLIAWGLVQSADDVWGRLPIVLFWAAWIQAVSGPARPGVS